ncbi:MAG: hypothetical protein H6R19_1380 [Proteobacteria bacterium]|nr:hypothetical protein [Pseudomonadota bacterium]
MKKAWLFLADRFDALRPRERLVLFLALAAAAVGLFFILVLNPAYARYQRAHTSLQQSAQELTAVQAAELALVQSASHDPDTEARSQIATLTTENAAMQRSLSTEQAKLASPEKMTEMLNDLIRAQKGLELVSVHTEPAEDLLAKTTPADKTPSATAPPAGAQSLFRHGITISVRGDYQTLAAYLRKVESLPWKINLADMSLKAGAYPQSTMTLTLYTLSLERTWLSF